MNPPLSLALAASTLALALAACGSTPTPSASADTSNATDAAVAADNPAPGDADTAASADTAAVPDTAAVADAAADASKADATTTDVTPADVGAVDTASAASDCADKAQGDLPPGVSLSLEPWTKGCTFSIAAAAGKFAMPYKVSVAAGTQTQVWNKPATAGNCAASELHGGLATWVVITGSNGGATQQWCLCDTGLCAPPKPTFAPVAAGSYVVPFSWDGNNWFGPSDTGNKPGPAMPPGTYTFKVRLVGEWLPDATPKQGGTFDHSVTRTFTLTP